MKHAALLTSFAEASLVLSVRVQVNAQTIQRTTVIPRPVGRTAAACASVTRSRYA
jgi:hypothetical protein